jgi:hypothetical protein
MAKNFSRRRFFDWPLLGKELIEQSARRQMYVIRVTYALALFGAFIFYYQRHLAEGPVLTLGRGLNPFKFLVNTQLATIFLFLPPMMAGALAQEKERDTLGLLFLTDLTPWELILQKYVGRLIPMLTLQFLSLPLLAVAYSLGGVSTSLLLSSALQLFLACLWVGALALECSAHEASTFQALIRCWGLCLALMCCCSFVETPFVSIFANRALYGPVAFGFPDVLTSSTFLITTFLFLAQARNILEERAFLPRRNPFAAQFKQLDQYWKDVRKLVRAMLRERDEEANALAEQVVRRALAASGDEQAWSPGSFLLAKQQIPNVLAFGMIFGVIALIALVTNIALDPKSGGAFIVVVGGIWILAALTVPIQSANAIASERINERLPAILTTPMTAREILDEWLAPVRRWIQFLMRPMLVIVLLEVVVKFFLREADNTYLTTLPLYLTISLLAMWIYPALAKWGCLWLGLRIRSQIRAMMTAFLLVAAWCILPPVASGYLTATGILSGDGGQWLTFVSPATVIGAAEMLGRKNDNVTADMIGLAFFQLGICAVIMLAMRRACLNNTDRHLGRV